MEASEYPVIHSVVLAMIGIRSVYASIPRASSGTHLAEHMEEFLPVLHALRLLRMQEGLIGPDALFPLARARVPQEVCKASVSRLPTRVSRCLSFKAL
jgi:hypothetical protein